MTRMIRSTMGAAVILFAGAALAQPPKDTSGYFPTKANTKWTYKTGDQVVEVKVSDKAVKFNNEDCVQLETSVGGKVVATELYSIKADGIYRVKVKDDKIDPGIKVLPIPPKKRRVVEVQQQGRHADRHRRVQDQGGQGKGEGAGR